MKIVDLRVGIEVVINVFLLLITIIKNVLAVEELLILELTTSIL